MFVGKHIHEHVSFQSVEAGTPGAVPIYRELDRRTGNHNWTASAAEHNHLVRKMGWKNEGIAWYAFPPNANHGVTVYRLYNPTRFTMRNSKGNGGNEHLYTLSKVEYNKLSHIGWRGENIAWRGI
ncbi:hypothetical protein [Bifidobacterium saimiriisciurei]|uniref:hypothetical protein n=1 Tax=Bifidobacterium saimiriisciurei TaxID=2661627 RepID=UPI00384BE707